MQILIGHDPIPANSATVTPPSSGPATDAAHAVVDVYNGSGVNHGAADESKALVALGYTAGAVSSYSAASHSKVYYGSGTASAAQQIAGTLGAAAVADSSMPAGHVLVYLGAGFTPPAGTATGGTSGTSAGSSNAGTSASAASAGATPNIPFQGKAVGAGGIPCVN